MRDNYIAGAVKDLKQDVEQFKSVQLSGADIYTNFTYELSTGYDFTVGASYQTGALYKFVADRQANPYGTCYVAYYKDASMTTVVDPRTLDGGIYLDVVSSTAKELHWEMLIWNTNAFTVYGKVYARTTDTGVFSYDT